MYTWQNTCNEYECMEVNFSVYLTILVNLWLTVATGNRKAALQQLPPCLLPTATLYPKSRGP